MAKTHSPAPGTHTRGNVNTTLEPAFGGKGTSGKGAGVGGGTYDKNKAPFDKPHDTGGGGIKEKFFDGMSAGNTPKSGGVGNE